MLLASAVVVWEWLNEHGRWRPYSPAVSHHIEAVARAGPRAGGSVVLGQADSRLAPYIIDLQSMHQFRQDTGESARGGGAAGRPTPPPSAPAPAVSCPARPGRALRRAPRAATASLGAAQRCPLPRCPRLPGLALHSALCSGSPRTALRLPAPPSPAWSRTACALPRGAAWSRSRSLAAPRCRGFAAGPRAALPGRVLSCLTRLIWICCVSRSLTTLHRLV